MMQERVPYGYICEECALKHKGIMRYPAGTTWFYGACEECGAQDATVCHSRDWMFPNNVEVVVPDRE